MGALDLRGLSYRYDGATAPALSGVSIQVPDGQVVSVIGPSGAGKSTLLRLAAGLQRTSEGAVLVDGRDVTDLPTERRDLTVMFQAPLLFDHLDVAGNVAFAPRLAGASRREARELASRYLRLVHLEGMDRRSVGSLSGGQQQRAALARALAAERGVLLLDEPFASLDRELRSAMHALLDEVRAALSPTMLVVTHDLDEAALADSTAVLVDGALHQHAPMAEIYRRPATVQTARLLGGFVEVPGHVTGSMHESSWGAVRIDPDCDVNGPAVLLLRREHLRLAAVERPQSMPGTSGTVVRRRAAGARTVITVLTAGGAVEVELPLGASATGQVRVELDQQHTPWALPLPGQDASQESMPVGSGSGSGPPTGHAPAPHHADEPRPPTGR